ncbi:MAG: ribosomal protein S18-alanine N-acetyltransferase [Desulfovibrio sp.]
MDTNGFSPIVFLEVEDIPDIMKLEQQCFAYHWSDEQYMLGLQKGAFKIIGLHYKAELVGYLAFSMIVDEMEILNIGVNPEFRRKGIGALLMKGLLQICKENGIDKGFLDVKVSNSAAICLYEKFGFAKIGLRKRYYPDTKEDALLYRLDL